MTALKAATAAGVRAAQPARSRWQSRFQLGTAAGLAVVVAVFPVLGDQYLVDVFTATALLAAAGMSWNLLGGYTGQFSLGHAAFFGIGAYTSVLLFTEYHVSPWLGMLAGAAIAGAVGLAIGALTLRLRGPFFVLASIAFAQVLLILAIQWVWLTGGSTGISVPYEPGFATMTFTDRRSYAWLIGGFVVLLFLLTAWLSGRRLGFGAVAVRENIAAAESLGIDSTLVKLKMTVLSAMLTAVTGTLSAFYIAFIEPESSFNVTRSIDFVLVAIIGGMGTAIGPVIGAVLVEVLHNGLRGALGSGHDGLYLVIYGGLLIVVMLFLPRGLVGGALWLRSRLLSGRKGDR
jgi:branched-chain amino acid transport system permease protein